MKCPVNEILKENDSVIGVVAIDVDGNKIKARAKAVIVATGGFGNSHEMIREYAGYEMDKDIYSFRIPELTGNGIRLAWAAGAKSTEMSMELIFGMPDPLSVPPQLHEACRQPHLMVNLLGERYFNEDVLPNVTFAANAIAQQKIKPLS
jgi:fumarate reductase flavoprotein subunit